jgi:hypothetical protein
MLSQSEAKPPPMIPVVTGDYGEKKRPIVTKQKMPIVTGDYVTIKAVNEKNYQKSKRRPAKPKISGCEVRNYEAGWNVFRVWYDKKQPGEKWPKKHRAYEGYLTQTDVEREKEMKHVSKKNRGKINGR